MRFQHRLLLLLLLPLLVVVLITALATFQAFDRLHVNLVQSRLNFILVNLRTTIEANLSLGLRIDQIAIVQELMEREQTSEPTIRAIDLFDRSGHSLYSTDRGAIGEPVAESWLRAQDVRRPDGTWRLAERGDVLLGLVVENDRGEIVGSLVITATADELFQRASKMTGFLVVLGLIATLVLGLCALAGARWLGRRAVRPFDTVTRLLSEPAPRDAPTPDAPASRVIAARTMAAATLQTMDGVARELAAIDADD